MTTAKRDQVRTLMRRADTNRSAIVDPGEEAVRERMRSYYAGSVPEECENAVSGWYGA